MGYRKVTAITRVKGYDDYKNFFDPEWMSTQACMEVFASMGAAKKTTFERKHFGLVGEPEAIRG